MNNRIFLMLTVLLAVPFNFAIAVDSSHTNMTVDQAKQLIAKSRDLDTIPEEIWRQLLTPKQFNILWEKGTEHAFTGALLSNKQKGTYVTAGCRLPVFHSSQKYKSGTGHGWESARKWCLPVVNT